MALAHLKAGVAFSSWGSGPLGRGGGRGARGQLGGGGGGGVGAAGGGALGVRAGANGRAAAQVRGGGVQKREPQPSPSLSRCRVGGGAMACAGLLTVCLIRPPAPEPRRPPAPAAGPAGHALFQDVSGERAGGAGPLALGSSLSLQLCPLSPGVSLGSQSLAVSPCPRLCVSVRVFPSRAVLGPCFFCLWISASRCLSLTLLSPFSVSLLISPCLLVRCHCPCCPHPQVHPIYV